MIRILGIAGILLLAGTVRAEAQACLGLPTFPTQLALQAIYESGENDSGYGARGVVHLPWSVGIGASYQRDEYDVLDTSGHTFGGVLAIELPFQGNSICLLTEPSLSTVDYPPGFDLPAAEVETLRIPAMVGAGTRLDFNSFFLVPSARGGAVFFRTTADPGTGTITEENSTEVAVEAGLTAGTGNAFANVGLNVISGQEGRPRFLLGVGIMLP